VTSPFPPQDDSASPVGQPPAGPAGAFAGHPQPTQTYAYGPNPYRVQPTSPRGLPLASFGERLGAFIIDGLIVGAAAVAVLLPLMGLLMFAMFSLAEQSGDATNDASPAFVFLILGFYALLFGLILLAQWIYYVEFCKRTGQTLGKKWLKLQIVPIDPLVPAVDRGMLGRRFLIQHVAGLVLFMPWLDGLWQLWDTPYQQCLHDKFAQTVVVKVG